MPRIPQLDAALAGSRPPRPRSPSPWPHEAPVTAPRWVGVLLACISGLISAWLGGWFGR